MFIISVQEVAAPIFVLTTGEGGNVKVATRIKVQGKGGQLLSAAVLKGVKALECSALSRGLDQANSRGAFQLQLFRDLVKKMHVPKCSLHQKMVILSCHVKLKVLEDYRHLSFWHWCFETLLASYPAQKPFSLNRMHSLRCIACASHWLPHVWTFTSVHRYPERVPRASCSSQCWDKAHWQQLPLFL